MVKSDIKFEVDGKLIEFSVMNNITETTGHAVENAVINWMYRTEEYTAESFCKYVESKPTGTTCKPIKS